MVCGPSRLSRFDSPLAFRSQAFVAPLRRRVGQLLVEPAASLVTKPVQQCLVGAVGPQRVLLDFLAGAVAELDRVHTLVKRGAVAFRDDARNLGHGRETSSLAQAS